MTAFFDEISNVCAELATYIYQLSGLETAYSFFEGTEKSYDSVMENWGNPLFAQAWDSDAQLPTDYPFNPSWVRSYSFWAASDTSGYTNDYIAEDQIKLAFQEAWKPTKTDFTNTCSLVIHSDVDSMVSGCKQLATSATSLYNFTLPMETDGDGSRMPDFVQNLRKSWTGLAGSGFYRFYDDLCWVVDEYSEGAFRLAVTSACVTNVIDQFQKQALKNAKKARDLAKQTLQDWQKDEGPVKIVHTDVDSKTLEVLDGISLATAVLGYVPSPAEPVLDAVSVVTAVTGKVAKTILETHAVMVPTSVDIAQGLIDSLSAGQREMLKALDTLQTSDHAPSSKGDRAPVPQVSFEAYVKQHQNNDAWEPPHVHFSN